MSAVWPGSPTPLGATYDGRGVNFAVYSKHAEGMEVCLFEAAAPGREVARFALREQTQRVFHGYVPGLRPGILYGLRAKGPHAPEKGLRFNPNKLLVDPYAKALVGKADWRGPLLGYKRGGKDPDLTLDEQDDAASVPKAVVLADDFEWGEDRRPQVPWRQSLIYEVHVKGFSARHLDIPKNLRGTYAGLSCPAAIEHFKQLGVTALELLPIHESLDDGFLGEKGLTNYWGYSTLSYFAPDQRFASAGGGRQVAEFKQMVKALHQAGIEVILDVVYNHTCEGNHLGPTLSLRGLDNPTYYVLKSDAPRYYVDYTGTGNSLNVRHPQTLKLILDSLRYWAVEMRVDGFRFDLATTLGRDSEEYDRNAAFFKAVHQDPVLTQLKLIAEPWDVGRGGYQVGNFPVLWSEWNGKYRDTLRRFWKGDENQTAEVGYRLTGSSDLYQLSGRKPSASVNFITCHDGFTLHDLVSYNEKHNEANGEQNRDGDSHNNSWNCGVEGETSDPKIVTLREQQKRNLIATLFLSQGVPMLSHGDEVGRTQKGNNNAYCQDNELAWVDWELDDKRRALLEFTRRMARLRRDQPVLQRRRFFQGAHMWDSTFKDLAWFRPDGQEMTKEDWQRPSARALGYLLGGDAIGSLDEEGNRVVGDTLLVLLNANSEPTPFVLPAIQWGATWELVVDTSGAEEPVHERLAASGSLTLPARSLVVLKTPSRI